MNPTPVRIGMITGLAALLLCAGSVPCGAGEIALVDVADVLKRYERFVTEMAQFRVRTAETQREFQTRNEDLEFMKRELAAKEEGTESHKVLQGRVVRAAMSIKSDIDTQKRSLQRAEAKLYADAYEKVLAAITHVAEANDFDLVLRFDSATEIDRSSSATILKHMNHRVLYQRGRNISDLVVEQLKETPETQNEEVRQARKENKGATTDQ